MDSIRFDDQVVIITGAGGGLGRAYALEVARRGGAVVVNDLGGSVAGDAGGSASMADRVVSEIVAAGGRAVASYDTVATAAGTQHIVATAIEAFGRVDALINNAGNMRIAPLTDSGEDDLMSMLGVHLFGGYHMTRAVWPHMQKQGYGRILFTLSSAGLLGNKTHGGYGAAKGALLGLMNTFALEGEALGIHCNGILPNAFSRMTDSASEQGGAEMRARAEAMMKAVSNSMQPEFTAPLATYLVSRECAVNHCLYSSCAGRFARVFIGMSEGWLGSRDQAETVESVAAHFTDINAIDRGFDTPATPGEEISQVLHRRMIDPH